MNSVFEANSFVVKLARVYPPEAAPKATRAVLGNLFEEARVRRLENRVIRLIHPLFIVREIGGNPVDYRSSA